MKFVGLALLTSLSGYSVAIRAQEPAPPSPQVYLAATGAADQLPAFLDGISDCLTLYGVTASHLSAAPSSRGMALQETDRRGGAYLLFLSLDFAPGENVRAGLKMQSFTVGGRLLWEEELKGGMIMVSQASYIQKMIDKACEKIEDHVGDEGLPARTVR